MADFVFDEFEVPLSGSACWKLLDRRRWTRKKAAKKALERSQELRDLWLGRCCHWQVERLVFVDESACNERTGDRKYGWSPKGVPCTDYQSIKRSERWSVLPAMTVHGYLPGTLIYQGGINSELFHAWLAESVLPQLEIGSIIVLDNASIHRSHEVRELVEAAGCRLEFLPPYSPDFNPIEQSFATLKAWIRKNQQLISTFSVFSAFLQYAVDQVGSVHAAAQFRSSGYSVD